MPCLLKGQMSRVMQTFLILELYQEKVEDSEKTFSDKANLMAFATNSQHFEQFRIKLNEKFTENGMWNRVESRMSQLNEVIKEFIDEQTGQEKTGLHDEKEQTG